MAVYKWECISRNVMYLESIRIEIEYLQHIIRYVSSIISEEVKLI